MSNPIEIEIVNPNVPTHNLQTKIVTPSKDIQVITADEGYYGLKEVIVSPPEVDIDLLANEINSMKESLTQGDATPEDIKLGKIAYVNGEKITGTYAPKTTLKEVLDLTKKSEYLFSHIKINDIDITRYISYEDTSNVTNMESMFAYSWLVTIPKLDTSNCQYFYRMFAYSGKIKTILGIDIKKALQVNEMFSDCYALTNLTILNIKLSLQVGSGSSWGHLLTLKSLLGLCQECINVGYSRTLTVGSKNMTKLANVYVKLTGEAEEDETLPKLPMVQCESTDDGAMTIDAYMALKNWKIA